MAHFRREETLLRRREQYQKHFNFDIVRMNGPGLRWPPHPSKK